MISEIQYYIQEEAIQAVTQKDSKLAFCAPELLNNEEVAMVAIKKDPWAFEYASDELKSNKPFIIKAIHEGINHWVLIKHATISIQSDIEVMSLAIEKSENGWTFIYAKGEVALNKELAAKALVKWGNKKRPSDLRLWKNIPTSLQILFPQNSWHEKAQSYLNQIEQEKQAEFVTGGCNEADGVVW